MAKRRANGEGTILTRTRTVNGKKRTFYEARITINGERISLYGKTQEEAREKLKKAIRDNENGIYAKGDKITFEEWLDIWLKEYTGDIKPGTYDYYEYLIRYHIKPELGKYRLNKITTEMLDNFYNKKKKQKKLRQKKDANGKPEEKTLSKKLVGDIRKVIGMALKKAVKKKKIAFNPNDYTEPIGKDKPEIEYLTPEEIVDFLEKISDDYWYPAIVTALGTGLRVGEIAGLKRSDFNFEEGFVKVQRNVAKVKTHATEGPKNKLIVQTPKTKTSIRKVPLPIDVINVIKDLFRQQDEIRGNVVELHNDYFVFCWPDGRMVNPAFLTKHFKLLVTKIKFHKDIHFHSLRHSYASLLLAQGEDYRVIQDNLGHKELSSVTAMYAHVIDELKKGSARKIDGFTKKKKTS